MYTAGLFRIIGRAGVVRKRDPLKVHAGVERALQLTPIIDKGGIRAAIAVSQGRFVVYTVVTWVTVWGCPIWVGMIKPRRHREGVNRAGVVYVRRLQVLGSVAVDDLHPLQLALIVGRQRRRREEFQSRDGPRRLRLIREKWNCDRRL